MSDMRQNVFPERSPQPAHFNTFGCEAVRVRHLRKVVFEVNFQLNEV